jgi:hypothetical protein
MNAPRPRGSLTPEAIACIRQYNGGTSGAAQILAALVHVDPLPPAIRAAYCEATDACHRLAELAVVMLEGRDAAAFGDVAETQPTAANETLVAHTCNAWCGSLMCTACAQGLPPNPTPAIDAAIASLDRATRATDPAPPSTWDVEAIAKEAPGVYDVAADRMGPNGVRVRLRGSDAEMREAIRERVTLKTGLACEVVEREDVMP